MAILAEKYATDYTWYVDVILKLIRVAGDYVSEEVWHRVIQVRRLVYPYQQIANDDFHRIFDSGDESYKMTT